LALQEVFRPEGQIDRQDYRFSCKALPKPSNSCGSVRAGRVTRGVGITSQGSLSHGAADNARNHRLLHLAGDRHGEEWGHQFDFVGV